MTYRTFVPHPDPTEPRYDEFGIKATQGGYEWSERSLDPEYVAGLRGEYDSHEPCDQDDDDRDFAPDDLVLECQSCHKRWTDAREDVLCPYCDSSGDHLVIEED